MTTTTIAAVQLVRGALAWTSGYEVDADGCPRAYHPGGGGLDALGNARADDGAWVGVVTNAMGSPLVQGPDDPAPGYYISQTALQDRSRAFDDPARYVDSSMVPYISIPPELERRGVKLGDLVMVAYKERAVAAIVADVGPHRKLGEGSIALAQLLGIPSSPRNGGVDHGVTWVAFPGSGAGWPVAVEDFSAQASLLFEQWGGIEAAEAVQAPNA